MDGQAALLGTEAAAVGCVLGRQAVERLLRLQALVCDSPFNVSGLREPGEIRRKHLVDSLACLRLAGLQAGERVVDIGTGAGFPGLPVAVACPAVRVELVDAAAKKAEFVRMAIGVLGLSNAAALQGRAEDLGRDAAWRQRCDCVLARALAPLRILAEYALPLCRPGGRLIALKGSRADAELTEAGPALAALGGVCTDRLAFLLPGGDETRIVLRVEQRGPVPDRFPRRAGVPQRRPL